MIRGSSAAIIPPVSDAGAVDGQSLARLINLHLHEGSDALRVAGTTNDSAPLDADHYTSLTCRVVGQVQGEIPVIAGHSTREAIALGLATKHAGADAGDLLGVMP